jgi:hypothetical protein
MKHWLYAEIVADIFCSIVGTRSVTLAINAVIRQEREKKGRDFDHYKRNISLVRCETYISYLLTK